LVDSRTFGALRAAGSGIVVTQPGYKHVALRNAADRVLEHDEMNDLEGAVLESTWLLDPLGAAIPTLGSTCESGAEGRAAVTRSCGASSDRGVGSRSTWIRG
jgi:hypothetical protein